MGRGGRIEGQGTSCWAVAEASHGADISLLPRSPRFALSSTRGLGQSSTTLSTNGHDSTIYLRRSVDS